MKRFVDERFFSRTIEQQHKLLWPIIRVKPLQCTLVVITGAKLQEITGLKLQTPA
jgi:hypothetical protein